MCLTYNYIDFVKGQIMSLSMNSMKNNIPRVIVAMCMFLTLLYCMELSSLVNQNEPMSRDMSEEPRSAWSLGCRLAHENAVKIATILRMIIVESLAEFRDELSILICESFSFLLSCICSNQNSMVTITNTLIILQLFSFMSSFLRIIIHNNREMPKILRVLLSTG